MANYCTIPNVLSCFKLTSVCLEFYFHFHKWKWNSALHFPKYNKIWNSYWSLFVFHASEWHTQLLLTDTLVEKSCFKSLHAHCAGALLGLISVGQRCDKSVWIPSRRTLIVKMSMSSQCCALLGNSWSNMEKWYEWGRLYGAVETIFK